MRLKRESISAIQSFIASVPLFANLKEESLALLARECRIILADKGEILFFQEDPSESVYIVRDGSISIVLNSQDGRDMVINEMHSGDLFGELGILTKKPRSTSAITRSKSELYIIPAEVFIKIVECEPHFAFRLLEITAARLQMSGKRESALAFMDAQARLARLLLQLEVVEAEKGYVTVSQDELAHRTGLIRQTVAKALGKWRRAGWLITGRGHILILNRKALEDLKSNLLV